MSRANWEERLFRFANEWKRTEISPKEWCGREGYSWGTAKAYISIKAAKALLAGSIEKIANSGKKSPNKTPNSEKAKSAKRSDQSGEDRGLGSPSTEKSPDTKRVHYNARPGNQNALKHGGYGRRLLYSDEISEDARDLALDDELFRLRAANLTAAESIGRLITRLEDATDEQRKVIKDEIVAADKAMMRNTVRIESLEHTKASIRKLNADTEYRIVATEKGHIEVKRMESPTDVSKGGGPQIIINLVNSPDGD